jgi:hypothetical protein
MSKPTSSPVCRQQLGAGHRFINRSKKESESSITTHRLAAER